VTRTRVIESVRKERGGYEETETRGQDPPGNALSGIRHLGRKEQAVYPLLEPRRMLHWTSDTGGPGTLPTGELEAREIRTFRMIDR
jgi:hypothetical protein